jgi:hypothetical protein
MSEPNPSGLCQCGCGLPTNRAPNYKGNYQKGEHYRFVYGHHHRIKGPDFVEVDRGHASPCWVWCKSKNGYGYGRIWRGRLDGRYVWDMAHRAYYEEHVGPIPEDAELHHLCRQKACVRPDHLRPVARREHMRTDGRLDQLIERNMASGAPVR